MSKLPLAMPMGKRIVLIGGGLVGLELAEFLIERGRDVVVLEPSAHLGVELSIIRRARVLHGLREHKVRMETGVEFREITAAGVTFERKGEVDTVAADNVIIAMGARPNTGLLEELTRRGLEATAIGDCQDVGYIEGAMLAGREIGVRL
jgi:2,4-dienoyl-CoA reductase (NADPH2)